MAYHNETGQAKSDNRTSRAINMIHKRKLVVGPVLAVLLIGSVFGFLAMSDGAHAAYHHMGEIDSVRC